MILLDQGDESLLVTGAEGGNQGHLRGRGGWRSGNGCVGWNTGAPSRRGWTMRRTALRGDKS